MLQPLQPLTSLLRRLGVGDVTVVVVVVTFSVGFGGVDSAGGSESLLGADSPGAVAPERKAQGISGTVSDSGAEVPVRSSSDVTSGLAGDDLKSKSQV